MKPTMVMALNLFGPKAIILYIVIIVIIVAIALYMRRGTAVR